jgi:hypothetical protein
MSWDMFLIQTSEYILNKNTLIEKHIFLSNLSDNNVIYLDQTYLFFSSSQIWLEHEQTR